jgi:hypothetical protein
MLDAQLVSSETAPASRAAQTVFFVDHEILDPEILLAGLASGTAVHYLPRVGNALDAMAAALEAHDESARHVVILAHGSAGTLRLSGRKIDIRALRRDVRRLARIREALAKDAEVTLLACATGAGAIGRAFLRTLEDALDATVHGAHDEVGGAAGWKALPAAQNHVSAAALALYPHRLGLLVEGNQITAVDETLSGGSSDDQINGYGGNDLLIGLADGDRLNGGDGNDTLSGGSGADTMSGAAGDDVLVINDGDLDHTTFIELIDGGTGNDVVQLGTGSYLLTRANISNVETISGSSGADTITAHASTAQNYALGGGDDVITGSSGADTISGEAGNDSIFGLAGDDVISGGDGADSLVGGGGTDLLAGGAGNDTFAGTVSEFNGDTISGLEAGDQILITGNTSLATSLNGTPLGSTINLGSGTLNFSGAASNLQITGTVSGGNSVLTFAVPATSTPSSGNGSTSGPVTVSDSAQDTVTGGARTIENTGSTSGSAAIIENTGNSGNLVTATLPPSVTITSEGPATAQSGSGAATTLVSAITGRNSSAGTELVSGAQTYLNKLATSTTLDIRTIVPTTTGSSVSEPIVISASGSGNQSEAFVIDVRSMPSGSTLQLDNIEFASIIGQATVTGGAGQNYAVGLAASAGWDLA